MPSFCATKRLWQPTARCSAPKPAVTTLHSTACRPRYLHQSGASHFRRHALVVRAAASQEVIGVDVAIIGAGIIGLCIAHAVLQHTDLSVALIERNQQVPGASLNNGAATGAGQGYIWLAHRDPASAAWHLARESCSQWQRLLQLAHLSPNHVEWQSSGSLLLATDAEEAAQLRARQDMLGRAGVSARYLDEHALRCEEPALHDSVAGGLLVSNDSQLNGQAAARALLAACQQLRSSTSAIRCLLGQAVQGLSTDRTTGCIETITTNEYRVRPRLATVIAAGAWTPQVVRMISSAEAAEPIHLGIQPRKGHLLEISESLAPPVIKHGLMEIGYAKHYQRGKDPAAVEGMDITFTATQSASGSLLLGSSRELTGFDSRADQHVVEAILERASRFLPALQHVSAASAAVRVGLRPFSSRGLPYVGRLPRCPNVYIAAGHEGSGLTFGPATGDLVCDMIAAEAHLPAYAAALQVSVEDL